ncbi:unnamed protein product [Orchesella dallaii]|uniref:Uncharacterized protein n=1 Tax=Orchesella dallaii TaxID=48710 RepID=A0ABP1Q7H6_9HEXA
MSYAYAIEETTSHFETQINNTHQSSFPADIDQVKNENPTKNSTSSTNLLHHDDKNSVVACPTPKLDPFHPSIKNLISKGPRKFDCQQKYPLLFNSTLDSMLIPVKNLTEMKKLGIKSCCYKTIQKLAGSTNGSLFEYSDKCFPISMVNATVVPPHHEFLGIHCEHALEWDNGTVVPALVDVHAFVPTKERAINKIHEKFPSIKDETQVNILILGLDSLSRMNFIRSLPQSYSFLKEKLDAVEMQGYNIIGYNTQQNIVAALTSHNEAEINASCQLERAFDNCPFIWKNFSERGYTTAFGEDGPTWGIFTYEQEGFKKPPTDYYLRSFGHVGEKLMGLGDVCTGPRVTWKILLDYVQKFAYSMGKVKPYFQFMWSTLLTHNGINDGLIGDKELLSTLEWLQQGEYLNKTMLIVMSDHGWRVGSILQRRQGLLEQRLPMLYFVMPKWFKEKYGRAVENMRNNQERLTTPYDLYATLVDLLSLKEIEKEKIKSREIILKELSSLPRGISLFLPIPPSRTCEMAGIEDHYCVCRNIEDIWIDSEDVIEAAKFAVKFINLILDNFPQCRQLELGDITKAKIGEDMDNPDVKLLLVFFNTLPNNGSFGATVVKEKGGRWSVSGTIDRTNLYGNQSHCVHSKEAKLYCFCSGVS